MKKRRLKKSVLVFLFSIILFVVVIFVINNKKTIENELPNEEVNEEIIEEEKIKKISLIAVGDVLIHDSVYKDAYNKETDTYDFSSMFTDIAPILKNYDLKFCNQESLIGGKILGISGYPSFNSPDEIGDELVTLGFNLISLANNHTLDKGEDAVNYSNSYWKNKEVITAGSYSSIYERNKINIYEKNGIKYAFLAYTTESNRNLSKEYLVNLYNDNKVKNDIEKIKDNVDLIIVSMHWGIEYQNYPTSEQEVIANYLSSLGVDIILGHHPHVVQPVKFINDTLVIYSLGNFISNQLVLGVNQGIGLIVGMDIVVADNKVYFENIYKELILSYSNNSTNFKVIPFSKLNNNLLNNYVEIQKQYMNILNGG